MERVALAPVQADGKRRDFNDLRRPSQAAAGYRGPGCAMAYRQPGCQARCAGKDRPCGLRTKRRNPSPSFPINGGTCHMRTVKLASVQVAEVLQSGSRGGPPRSMPVHVCGRHRPSRSLAQEGAVNRCPSVVRKPTRLSLENTAGGQSQRLRQAPRRLCGTSWRICTQPVRRPQSESNASSAPAGEAHLCPTVGHCARRGTASPTVRTPSV